MVDVEEQVKAAKQAENKIEWDICHPTSTAPVCSTPSLLHISSELQDFPHEIISSTKKLQGRKQKAQILD